MKTDLVSIYLRTFPNIEKFYINNGGKDFVVQLFLDKSNLLKKLSKIIPAQFLYDFYRVLEPVISFAVVTIQYFRVQKRRKKSIPFEVAGVKRLYLNYAHLLIARSKSAGIFEVSQYWLEQPFSGVSVKGLEDKNVITIYQLLDKNDCRSAYHYAIKAIHQASINNPNHFIRRSYTALEFYLTYFAVKKFSLDTELVFANHIDRWAILFDVSFQNKKILVQHGIETKTANWPVKLNTVTTLYAFNEELGHNLKEALLTTTPEYKYMSPTINLVENKEDSNYKVLIVCHPVAMREREEYLIAHLQQSNITVYAKTHYVSDDLSFYKKLSQRYRYHLITTQVFPKVNILISYRSTLVSEYEICGIPALMYADFKSLDDIVTEVKRQAEKFKRLNTNEN